MATTYRMRDDDPDKIERRDRKGNKKPLVAKGVSAFSTPFLDDQENLKKFQENADRILRNKKKPKKGKP